MKILPFFARWTNAKRQASQVSNLEVPSAVWTAVCALRRPVVLLDEQLIVRAATPEALDAMACAGMSSVQATLIDGLASGSRIALQTAVGSRIPLSRLRLRGTSPWLAGGRPIELVSFSVSPVNSMALVILPRDGLENLQTHRVLPEILTQLPVPTWLIDNAGVVVFANEASRGFPVHYREGQPWGVVEAGVSELLLRERIAEIPIKARNSGWHAEVLDFGALRRWTLSSVRIGSGASGLVVIAAVTEGDSQDPQNVSSWLAIREAERIAVARDIHDGLGQELTVLKLEVGQLQRMVSAGSAPNELLERMAGVRQIVEGLGRSARRIASDLRPDIVQASCFSQVAQKLVGDLRERFGLPLQITIEPTWVEPDEDVAHHLHRSLQEILNNLGKHARASTGLVRLGATAEDAFMEVTDDGVGIPKVIRQGSLGLSSLRERAQLLGGRLIIRTRPEVNGTCMRIEIPLRAVAP